MTITTLPDAEPDGQHPTDGSGCRPRRYCSLGHPPHRATTAALHRAHPGATAGF
jgi:hypothetical protein